MHKKIIQLATVISVLAVGISIGWLSAQPKKTFLNGKSYKISPRHSLTVWFHDTGSISEVCIRDIASNQLVLDDIFHENGFLKSFQRNTVGGVIQDGFGPDGTLHLRKHYKGKFLDRSEYYNKEGELEKTKYFGKDN